MNKDYPRDNRDCKNCTHSDHGHVMWENSRMSETCRTCKWSCGTQACDECNRKDKCPRTGVNWEQRVRLATGKPKDEKDQTCATCYYSAPLGEPNYESLCCQMCTKSCVAQPCEKCPVQKQCERISYWQQI